MERKLYRILNNEETYDFHYTSYIYQSEWRCSAIEFYEQIEKACKLSQECNIKISSALRIATQYGWVTKMSNKWLGTVQMKSLLIYFWFTMSKKSIFRCNQLWILL